MAGVDPVILKRQRAAQLGNLTRVETFMNATSAKIANNEFVNISELEARLDKLDIYWASFQSLIDQALMVVEDVTILEPEIEVYDAKYYAVRSNLEDTISSLKPVPTQSVGGGENIQANLLDMSIAAMQATKPLIKLPPIQLPDFNGAPDRWIPYRDIFKSMIHDNKALPSVQKFYYLKNSIKDLLRPNLLTGITESENAYDDAWKKVNDTYDDKRDIANRHFNNILTAKKISPESFNDINNLVTTFSNNVTALQKLMPAEDLFSSLMAHQAIHRLDNATRILWETENTKEIPLWNDLEQFLIKRAKVLEVIPAAKGSAQKPVTTIKPLAAFKQFSSTQPTSSYVSKEHHIRNCPLCESDHVIYKCSKFLSFDISSRQDVAKKNNLCFNCLKLHYVRDCTSTSRCLRCQKKHHTLLHNDLSADDKVILSNHHDNDSNVNPSSSSAQSKVPFTKSPFISKACTSQAYVKTILLSTAIILIKDSHGNWHKVRALLDNGSQSNLMTISTSNALHLQREKVFIDLTGIGDSSSVLHQSVSTHMKSTNSDYETEIDFLLMPKITGITPYAPVDIGKLGIPFDSVLADPTFYVPGNIDVLIGVEYFFQLLTKGRIQLPSGPIMQNTVFGWIIGGKLEEISSTQRLCNVNTLSNLQNAMERFWKLEDYKLGTRFITPEEAHCEETFVQTHQRDKFGRFVIEMPLKSNYHQLANNFYQARKQFLTNEKNLMKNPELKKQYCDFMNEYKEMNHMEQVDLSSDDPSDTIFYLPHHAVLRPESSTTKCRVVFNASSKTRSGLSLNNVLCVGPTIQTGIFEQLLQFRQHTIVIKADIEKMYRQIEVFPYQRKLQRIIWRDNQQDSLKIFELKTVTYGTSSASFIATRCLKQLAIEQREKDPVVARNIEERFSMDDLITGGESLEEVCLLKERIDKVISSAQMKLRKWNSNCTNFIESIVADDREEETLIKVLGIKWDTQSDEILFVVKPIDTSVMTKRKVLSEIAKIYDPEGLLGSVLFKLKCFMKRLWQMNVTWDCKLSDEIAAEWCSIAQSMTEVNKIRIPRQALISSFIVVRIVAFSDASMLGFGANVYLCSEAADGHIVSRLLCAKSRVAPSEVKTLARLELCGAVLMAELVDRVKKSLSVQFTKITCMMDSTIALSWLKQSPCQLQTFIANRVASIQELCPDTNWRHVRSEMNPADYISRGLMPIDIINNDMWWNGPDFITQPEDEWPRSIVSIDPDDPIYKEGFKKVTTLLVKTEHNPFIAMMENSSSTYLIKRKIGYVIRFIHNMRAHKKHQEKRSGRIGTADLQDAERIIARLYQQKHFKDEYNCLSNQKPIARGSCLKNLDPFLDSQGLIRVGGRLRNALSLDEDQKHQIVLPKCYFARIIIRETHQLHLHAGQQATRQLILMKYWPLSAKQMIKKELHFCVRCFRARPITVEQFMGQQPKVRVSESLPFQNCGMDFAGPINIKLSATRRAKTAKAYIILFVCMATKAVHMDVVTDLTTKCFLAALDRFVSRRGLPANFYMDNGGTFIGARNHMSEFYEFLKAQDTINSIDHYTNQRECNWKFIPPRAPHFGGLWESAVKSAKYHMKRIVKDALLTYEELTTLFCRIEAVLNSRPLTAISNDPNDLSVLTPGHFLIGRPLVAKPEIDLTEEKPNRLERWDRIQQMQQHFWKRWHNEYLNLFQVRAKNFKEKVQVKDGSLVVLKEDNLAPLHWPLGRIISSHPGSDGIVRVVEVRTPKGIYNRPVTKIALLPVGNEPFPVAQYVE